MRKKDYVDERRRKKEERSIIRPKQWGGKVTRGTRRWRGSDIGQYCICSTNKGGRCFLWDCLPLLYFSVCYPRTVTLTCHPVIYDRQTPN